MSNALDEPLSVIEAAKREFTAVGSLNVTLAVGLVSACENAIGALYQKVAGRPFPYQQYSRHKPGAWVSALDLGPFYSTASVTFLSRLDGFSLDKARYPSAALLQYKGSSAAHRSKELIDGTVRFVEETAALLGDPAVLGRIRSVVK